MMPRYERLNATGSPCTDENNQPILVQIQYRLVFNPEMLPPVNVRGRVQEAGLRDPSKMHKS